MSLLLRHTPGEWDGTFAIVLEALVRDLLSDGEPIAIRINNEAQLRTLTGCAACSPTGLTPPLVPA